MRRRRPGEVSLLSTQRPEPKPPDFHSRAFRERVTDACRHQEAERKHTVSAALCVEILGEKFQLNGAPHAFFPGPHAYLVFFPSFFCLLPDIFLRALLFSLP